MFGCSPLQETPSPGAYRLGDFVEDLRKRPTTYGFRNTGRRPQSASAASAPSGDTLLPGAYEHKDFLEQSFRRSMAYSFRAIDRDSGPKIGHGYGDKVCMKYCTAISIIQRLLCYRSWTQVPPGLICGQRKLL